MRMKSTTERRGVNIPKGVLRHHIKSKTPLPKHYTKNLDLPILVKQFGKRSGKSNKFVDKDIEAMKPGLRISKSGKLYPEGRKNRSDSHTGSKSGGYWI